MPDKIKMKLATSEGKVVWISLPIKYDEKIRTIVDRYHKLDCLHFPSEGSQKIVIPEELLRQYVLIVEGVE